MSDVIWERKMACGDCAFPWCHGRRWRTRLNPQLTASVRSEMNPNKTKDFDLRQAISVVYRHRRTGEHVRHTLRDQVETSAAVSADRAEFAGSGQESRCHLLASVRSGSTRARRASCFLDLPLQANLRQRCSRS